MCSANLRKENVSQMTVNVYCHHLRTILDLVGILVLIDKDYRI